MARLGRRQVNSYGHSRLRPPTVVGTPSATFVADPVRVHIPIQPDPRRRRVNRTSLPQLILVNEPTVASVSDPLKVHLPIQPDPRRREAKSAVGRQIVVGAGRVNRPVQVNLESHNSKDRDRRAPYSKLRPPAVITPAAAGADLSLVIQTTLAPPPKQGRVAQSNLAPPAVIDPGVVFSPVDTELAPSSKLGRRTKSKLSKPTVVAEAFRASPIEVSKAPPPKQGRRAKSKLSPPTVVAAAAVAFTAAPVRVTTATQASRDGRRRDAKSALPRGQVVGSGITQRPIFTELVATSAARAYRRRNSIYQVRPPTVVTPVSTAPPNAPVKVSSAAVAVARDPRRRDAKSVLPALAVVFPFVSTEAPAPPIRTTEVAVRAAFDRGRRRAANSHLTPPAAISSLDVFYTLQPWCVLPQSIRHREVTYKLRPPSVVAPIAIKPPSVAITSVAVDTARERLRRRRNSAQLFVPPKIVVNVSITAPVGILVLGADAPVITVPATVVIAAPPGILVLSAAQGAPGITITDVRGIETTNTWADFLREAKIENPTPYEGGLIQISDVSTSKQGNLY